MAWIVIPADINTPEGLDERAFALLACPKCRAPLLPAPAVASCSACAASLKVRDRVLVARDPASHSYFDEVYEVMRLGNHARGTWDIFYKEQAAAVERSLHEGEVLVDVGCGPELPYRKNGAYVIGVDASFHSIRANEAVDLRVFASAGELPLADRAADAIVCFYSIHHMTGGTVADNRDMVGRVFREFARVLTPGGRLMIFDMSPWMPFAALEELAWNPAKRRLGDSLDMFFWKDRSLERLCREALPGASFSKIRYGRGPFQTFPPIFSKPGLRFPRFLYPFDINLYVWQSARDAARA